MSWPLVELGEFAVKRGGSRNPAKHLDTIFQLYSIPAFDKGNPEIVKGSEIGSSKKLVQSGDVLLSRIVPHIRRAWVVDEYNEYEQIASGEWIIFRSDKVDNNYLKHWLVSDPFHVQFMSTVSGVGGSLLRARPDYVYKIKIPFPPLAEQKRIAAILDKADAIRRKRQQAIDLTDKLLRSVFLDMFGDPVVNPKNWNTGSLMDFVAEGDRINYGVVQPGGDYEDGVPLVRAGDIKNMRVMSSELKLIDPVIEKSYKRSRLHGDEVLIACVGAIGNIGLVKDNQKGFNIARAVARVRFNNKINRLFGAYMLSCPSIQAYFMKETRIVAQPTLNIKQIKETPIITPPVEEQLAFAKIVMLLNKLLLKEENSKENSDDLFSSLTQRAFRGELTKQTKVA